MLSRSVLCARPPPLPVYYTVVSVYVYTRVCIHVYSLWSLQSVCMILRGPCFQSQPESTEPRPGNDIDNSASAAYAVPSTVLLLHPFSGVKGAPEGHYLLWFGLAHSCCTVCRPGICSPGRLHACFTNQCPLRASQHTAHACMQRRAQTL